MKSLSLVFLMFTSLKLLAGPKKEYTYNDTTLKKLGKYTLSTPEGSARPARPGLMIYFHGSGSTQTYAAGFDGLDQVAQKLGLLAMAVQAPNGHDTWANHATGPSNQHDQYVKNLLDKVFPSITGLDKNKILFVGISAGSTFLSGDFLPRFITRYKGGAVLLCGGGGPISLDNDLFTPVSKSDAKGFPLAVFIQQADFLYRQTLQGVTYWKSRKAEVAFENPAGGSHCGFDGHKEMERLGRRVLGL